ncbi:MAG: response regulator [Desulfobacterales bacterium]|nr:response regulator [Desulfobacterales bacterium]
MVTGKILIVDDEPSVRQFFDDVLTEKGYEVMSAQNAGEALKTLEKDDINVIFLDLKLFGMNGIELCRQIKASKPLSIIYAITGWAALFGIEECRDAGFDDCFMKPVSVDRIYKAADDAFEKLDRWTNHYGKV